MHHEMSSEHSETCCCSEQGFMEHLTDDQKKKIMVMHIDMKIHWMEQKIKHMEGAIEGKKKMIANMRQIQEMLKQNKVEVEEAEVEPIHPSENRGGKKRGLLDTCK